jgi:hypothetical protein
MRRCFVKTCIAWSPRLILACSVLIAGCGNHSHDGTGSDAGADFAGQPAGLDGSLTGDSGSVDAAALPIGAACTMPADCPTATCVADSSCTATGSGVACTTSRCESGPLGVVTSTYPQHGEPALGLVDGDDHLDLVLLSCDNNLMCQVTVVLGVGDGTFRPEPAYTSAAFRSTGPHLALGDIDGDGKLDVVTADGALLFGNGDGTLGAPQLPPASALAYAAVALGDLDHDGKIDLVSTHGPSIEVWKNQGGVLATPVAYGALPNTPHHLAIADMNHDGKLDVAVAGHVAPWIFLGAGDGTFDGGTRIDFDNTNWLAVADYDRDGVEDLASAGVTNTTLKIGFGPGLPSLTITDVLLGGYLVEALGPGDFNGDGLPDFALIDFATGGLVVYLGFGDRTFQAARFFPGRAGTAQAENLAVGDLDGDGKSDVVYDGVVFLMK